MKVISLLVVLFASLPGVLHAGFFDSLKDFSANKTSTPMQEDFDVAKLNDLIALADLVERYHKVKDAYPFEGVTNVSNYVHIATKGQKKYASGRPPFSHKMTNVNEFISELKSVLGDEIIIPFDPQKIPVHKPNFYIYKIHGSTYYLAVHLYQPYPFAKHVSKNYYKLEITNSPQRSKGAWLYKDLISNPEYISARSKAPNKPGYVKSLRDGMGNNNAF